SNPSPRWQHDRGPWPSGSWRTPLSLAIGTEMGRPPCLHKGSDSGPTPAAGLTGPPVNQEGILRFTLFHIVDLFALLLGEGKPNGLEDPTTQPHPLFRL